MKYLLTRRFSGGREIGYNLEMANLPAKLTDSSVPDRYVETLVRQMAAGIHPREIARKMYPNPADKAKRWSLYAKLKRLALDDHRVANGIAQDARLELMVGLTPTVAAMAQRGARGRVDAGKLIMEASGFHNPKVKHEHSGEIKVKLEMPRPDFNHEVPDADVVEEE